MEHDFHTSWDASLGTIRYCQICLAHADTAGKTCDGNIWNPDLETFLDLYRDREVWERLEKEGENNILDAKHKLRVVEWNQRRLKRIAATVRNVELLNGNPIRGKVGDTRGSYRGVVSGDLGEFWLNAHNKKWWNLELTDKNKYRYDGGRRHFFRNISKQEAVVFARKWASTGELPYPIPRRRGDDE